MTDPVLTAAEMRAAEAALMAGGVSEWDLMQRAGEGAAQWVWRMAAGRPVTVLCGPGNNGGDGHVIAEWLRRRGLAVEIVAPHRPVGEAARRAADHYRGDIGDGIGGVFVDCLFGTGLSRPLESDDADLLRNLAAKAEYRIAIDLPSGIESDGGRALAEDLPEYDLTLALGAWKRSHWTMPAMAGMGERHLVDIGIDATGTVQLSAPPVFTAPASNAHKYSRGLLAVIGGAMPGAALLACRAAMHSGAGYVKLLGEHSHPDLPADLVQDDSDLASALSDDRIDAVLVGPGLGRDDDAKARLESVLRCGKRVVLDADALVMLAQTQATLPRDALLTPHEGELNQLCDAFRIERSNTKVERAKALHEATGAAVLAKGADNVLVGKLGIRFFPPGSAWLSTAGTGDVLAGIAASRLATHGDAFRAAEEAVWLHGRAATLCGAALSARDLALALPKALESLA